MRNISAKNEGSFDKNDVKVVYQGRGSTEASQILNNKFICHLKRDTKVRFTSVGRKRDKKLAKEILEEFNIVGEFNGIEKVMGKF